MFICPIQINSKKAKKILLVFLLILTVIFLWSFVQKYFFNSKNDECDACQDADICNITNDNYTDVLKIVHDNLDSYVGQKIHYSGYVYRLSDFEENKFVLARNMVISSDFQTLIVGFFCECKTAYKWKDFSWVEIEGTISKGNYHGEIPVIQIDSIKACEKPNDEYVYPPTDDMIPTSTII